jgi:pimeloyl-ACP methyl ester carboxylesterase
MFIWGSDDPLVPSRFSDHVADELPDAPQVILSDCGHVPQVELPERTHELVREFIGSSGRSSQVPLRRGARAA